MNLLWHAATSGRFDPLALGPVLFLDFQDGKFTTEAGSRITRWDDISGNDNHATAAAGSPARPTLGATGVEFDGVGNYLIMPQLWVSWYTATTIIIVAKSDNATDEQRMFAYNNDGGYVLMRINYGGERLFNFYAYDGTAKQLSSDLEETDTFVTCFIIVQNAAINGFVNGTSMSGNGTALGALQNISPLARNIGVSRWGTPYFFDGGISHLSIYPYALSDTQRQQTEAYLAKRYGVTL